MVSNHQVDVLSPVSMPHTDRYDDDKATERLQRKKWYILFGVFILTLAVSQSWVWLRAPIYQSTATLHFTYNKSLKDIPQSEIVEQLSLNQKSLLSISMLQAVNDQVKVVFSGESNLELIGNMLAVEVIEQNNTINLAATGAIPEMLSLALTAQLERYFLGLNAKSSEGSEEKIANINDMLVSIEAKIVEQQAALSSYSEENNIVSLERGENRVLNKISALNNALDTAESEQLSASEHLKKIELAEQEGKVLLNPKDESGINNLKAKIEEIELELKGLSERYTPQYMEKDPKIKGITNNLIRLRERLKQRIIDSQANYKAESKSLLVESQSKINVLSLQLKEFGANAQVFDQKLKEYNRMTNSLNMLADQSQKLKNELVAHEVQKPLMPTIKVIEEPYIPSVPISPHYLRDALIALAGSILTAIICLIIFSYIVRQKSQGPTIANYTVVPSQQQGHAINQQQLLAQEERARLQMQAEPLKLEQAQSEPNHLRLLTEDECKKLYQCSTAQGKLVLALLLSGIHPEELTTLLVAAIDSETGALNVSGRFPREVAVTENIGSLLLTLKPMKTDTQTILDEPLSAHDMTQMFINSAHDAELVFPEQLSIEVIRHTYLTFLATQHLKINELEQIAGHILPSELARYRGLKRNDVVMSVDDVTTNYPLDN